MGQREERDEGSTSCMVGAGIYINASCEPVTLVARMHGNACVANYMKVVRPAVHTVEQLTALSNVTAQIKSALII